MADVTLISQLIRILTPLLTTNAERRALLIEAFGMDSPIVMNVDFDGASQPFLLSLIAFLHSFGEIEPGKSALWALLETAKSHVGADVALKIDALKPQIDTLASTPLPTDAKAGRKARRNGLIVVIMLVALAAVAVILIVYVNPATHEALPPGFNVVVAGFGMEQSGNSITAAPLADNVSDEIYAALSEVSEIDNLLPWSDPRVGRILDLSEDARRDHAVRIASELNADVVIFGTTSVDGFYLNVYPVFDIAGDLAALEPELSGKETFGTPLQVLKDSDDDMTAQTAMRDRLTVMRYFLKGISKFITGDFQAALTAFSDAIAANVPGTEMLYVFAGNAAMRQNDPGKALTLYTTALETRPNYARALGGRGLALFRMGSDLDRVTPPSANRPITVPSDAFCTDEIEQITPQNYAALAEICYQQGLASPDQPGDSDVDIKLNFALGQLELWRSLQNYGDYWQRANDYLARVIDLYDSSNSARQARTQQIAAQAHAALAQALVSTRSTDLSALQTAADHYATAISLLDTDINRAYNRAFIDSYQTELTALTARLDS